MNKIEKQYSFFADLISQKNTIWTDSNFTIKLKLTTEIKSSLEEVDDSQFFDLEVISGSDFYIPDLDENEDIEIKVTPTNFPGGYFFGENLSDLLSIADGKHCSSAPNTIFLQEENYRSWISKEEKQSIHAYLKVIEFIQLLKDKIVDHEKDEYLYLIGSQGKLKLPTKYAATSIIHQPGRILDSVAAITSLFKSKELEEEKKRSLKITLIDSLHRTPQESRFDQLLDQIENINDQLHHSYDLMISNYSFENDQERIREESRTFLTDISSAIQSAHTKIISIPLATILPGLLIKTQKIDTTGLDGVLLLSSLFVSIILAFVLMQQYQILKTIRTEYKAKWKRMRREIPTLSNKLEFELKCLEKSFKLNRGIIFFISIWILIFLSFPLLAYIETPTFKEVSIKSALYFIRIF